MYHHDAASNVFANKSRFQHIIQFLSVPLEGGLSRIPILLLRKADSAVN